MPSSFEPGHPRDAEEEAATVPDIQAEVRRLSLTADSLEASRQFWFTSRDPASAPPSTASFLPVDPEAEIPLDKLPPVSIVQIQKLHDEAKEKARHLIRSLEVRMETDQPGVLDGNVPEPPRPDERG